MSSLAAIAAVRAPSKRWSDLTPRRFMIFTAASNQRIGINALHLKSGFPAMFTGAF